MKITGRELSVWMGEAWPAPDEDWFWDHDLFEDQPNPGATYDTGELGAVMYQGRGEDPTRGDGYDLAALVRKWRKDRDYDVFTVTVPKARSAEVVAAIKAMGAKVTA